MLCYVQLYKRKTSKKGSEKDKISKQAFYLIYKNIIKIDALTSEFA